ncbi:hypothetical protein [Helicobacter bilis]|nr:hypothetical protein [Helicobacter bilis]
MKETKSIYLHKHKVECVNEEILTPQILYPCNFIESIESAPQAKHEI